MATATTPMLRRYEVMYIVRPDIPEADYTAAVGKFEKSVVDEGGQVINIDEWGARPFAYPIERLQRGSYVIMEFAVPAERLPAIRERFALDEKMLRYQFVRLPDAAPPSPDQAN